MWILTRVNPNTCESSHVWILAPTCESKCIHLDQNTQTHTYESNGAHMSVSTVLFKSVCDGEYLCVWREIGTRMVRRDATRSTRNDFECWYDANCGQIMACVVFVSLALINSMLGYIPPRVDVLMMVRNSKFLCIDILAYACACMHTWPCKQRTFVLSRNICLAFTCTMQRSRLSDYASFICQSVFSALH